MIIKLIPETDEEILRYKAKGISEVEHSGVREFMLFGNKIDVEGDLADFHEWHGAYRYLMGSLDYFYQFINDKRRSESQISPLKASLNAAQATRIDPFPVTLKPGMLKQGTVETKIQHIDVSNFKGQEQGAFEDEEIEAEIETDKANNFEDVRDQIEEQVEEAKQELIEEAKPHGLRILK